MNPLAVREMVLYKHGIGFFVRQGDVRGTIAQLTFYGDGVDIILKSLSVFDHAGGQVYGVHYQTPANQQIKPTMPSINLKGISATIRLLQNLRGRDVSLVVEDENGNHMSYNGEMIGVDQNQGPDGSQSFFVCIMTGNGASHIFPFDSVCQLTMRDQASRRKLVSLLSSGTPDDEAHDVTIRLSEGLHDLEVRYIAPSPVWRVSYRLVATSSKDGTTGTVHLQGWGIFENTFDEDLNNVKVTLATGQPISYMYASNTPDGAMVDSSNRITQLSPAVRPNAHQSPAWVVGNGNHGMGVAPAIHPATQSHTDDSETDSLVESFQYDVITPVTVKRGESALVPIVTDSLSYHHELLYNREKLADHPIASICFNNDTDVVLEHGSVTLVENGEYKGEAMIGFTPPGGTVYIPYSVEKSVIVNATTEPSTSITGLAIRDDYVLYQHQKVYTTTYSLQNKTQHDRVVTIEVAKSDTRQLHDTRDPDTETASVRRWKVNVPAGETVAFIRKEYEVNMTSQHVRSLKIDDLDQLADNTHIDSALVEGLHEVVEAEKSIVAMRQQSINLHDERRTIFEKQEQLRKNMGTLSTTGEEGDYRQQVIKQMREAQDRIEAIDTEKTTLQATISETDDSVKAMIMTLSKQFGDLSD